MSMNKLSFYKLSKTAKPIPTKIPVCKPEILREYSNEFKNTSNKDLKNKFNEMVKVYYEKYKQEIPENEIPQI